MVADPPGKAQLACSLRAAPLGDGCWSGRERQSLSASFAFSLQKGIVVNIILIVSDTLRYDCVSYHGRDPYRWDLRDRPRTPCIDRFAAQALVFDRAYTGSFPTIPMRSEIISGRLTFPYRGWTPLPEDETILAEELTQAGYVSSLICDTPHLMRDGHRFDRGFSA